MTKHFLKDTHHLVASKYTPLVNKLGVPSFLFNTVMFVKASDWMFHKASRKSSYKNSLMQSKEGDPVVVTNESVDDGIQRDSKRSQKDPLEIESTPISVNISDSSAKLLNYVLPEYPLKPSPKANAQSTKPDEIDSVSRKQFLSSAISLIKGVNQYVPSLIKGSLLGYINPTIKSLCKDTDKAVKDKQTPRIAIIGIHGWYPMKILQKVVGTPSSSDRYVQKMSTQIEDHYTKVGTPLPSSSILKIPLEGEGKIMDRANLFYTIIRDKYCGFETPQMPSTSYTRNNKDNKIFPSSSSSFPNVATSSLLSDESAYTLREVDHIYIVAHSQGAPVAILLLDRLIQSGLVSISKNDIGSPDKPPGPKLFSSTPENGGKSQKVTILSMAGILHGPFPQLGKSLFVQYIEAESSRELFELNDTCQNKETVEEVLESSFASSPDPFRPDSDKIEHLPENTSSRVEKVYKNNVHLSQRIRSALIRLLGLGVKIVSTGSWMDQVVPLYSATLYGYRHKNLLRTVYIDSRHYMPDFLTNLVVFCLSLKNAGLSDHGLLVYLSEFIAGSLVNDNSHSTIYEEPKVYQTAITWMLSEDDDAPYLFDANGDYDKTSATSLLGIDSEKSGTAYISFQVPEKLNHYFLPWIMYKLFTDPYLATHPYFSGELIKLQRQFSTWSPSSKSSKELKRKLEPLSTLNSGNLQSLSRL